MSVLFGAAGLQDSDYLYAQTAGQQLVYSESMRLLDYYNQDVQASLAIFVDGGPTDKHALRFKLPGNGRLQRRGRQSRPGAVKAFGQWDVAFPLEDYAAQLSEDDVTMAYMTLAEYERHFQTVLIQDANTIREELLKALFNNNARPFVDEIWGTLNVQPLANGDTVLYPPLIGSMTDGTANHYLATNYTAITDSANPIKSLIVSTLQKRFGTPTAGSNIAVFYNSAQDDAVKGLASFVPVQYRYVEPGVNTATVKIPGIPDKCLAGTWEVTGTCSGAVMCKWDFIPAGYMIGIHLDAPPPVTVRVDPAATGLGQGLQLMARDLDTPFADAFWRHRFGMGASNRLAAVVVQVVASSTYTIPTQYA